MPAKITLMVKVENGEGFEAQDTVTADYLVDPPSNELGQHVKSITRGFQQMVELMRSQPSAGAVPVAIQKKPRSRRGPQIVPTSGRREQKDSFTNR